MPGRVTDVVSLHFNGQADFGSHVTKLALLGWAAEASAAEKVLAVAAAKSGEDNDDDSLQQP